MILVSGVLSQHMRVTDIQQTEDMYDMRFQVQVESTIPSSYPHTDQI